MSPKPPPTPVEAGTPFTVTLPAEHWIAIGDLIGTLPWTQADPILTSIKDQHQMQLLEGARKLAETRDKTASPTEGKSPFATERLGAFLADEPEFIDASLNHAKECLRLAEMCRRQGEGTMSTSPRAGETVDDDYAVATLLISGAMQHLDEALPSGQGDRASTAFTALEEGTRRLRLWLEGRGVFSARACPESVMP